MRAHTHTRMHKHTHTQAAVSDSFSGWFALQEPRLFRLGGFNKLVQSAARRSRTQTASFFPEAALTKHGHVLLAVQVPVAPVGPEAVQGGVLLVVVSRLGAEGVDDSDVAPARARAEMEVERDFFFSNCFFLNLGGLQSLDTASERPRRKSVKSNPIDLPRFSFCFVFLQNALRIERKYRLITIIVAGWALNAAADKLHRAMAFQVFQNLFFLFFRMRAASVALLPCWATFSVPYAGNIGPTSLPPFLTSAV